MKTDIISQRIKECRKKKGATQEDVAKILNVQRQIVSYYETGSRVPNIDDIITLAEYFNVTTDYLLGNSDVSTTDKSLNEICALTGLSESAIKMLHSWKGRKHLEIFNYLFDTSFFSYVFLYFLKPCFEEAEKKVTSLGMFWESLENLPYINDSIMNLLPTIRDDFYNSHLSKDDFIAELVRKCIDIETCEVILKAINEQLKVNYENQEEITFGLFINKQYVYYCFKNKADFIEFRRNLESFMLEYKQIEGDN